MYKKNEYQIPPSFAQTDIVIDVGAHIGSFSYLAAERGAGIVYAVEANAENYQIAKQHLEPFKSHVRLKHRAVWRSDSEKSVLYHSGYKSVFDHPHQGIEVNTGAGNVLFSQTGEEVLPIAFDTLLEEATQIHDTHSIRCLKLDCEGSEWPILLTSTKLHLIDEIVGEYHEIGGAYDALDPHRLSLPRYKQFTVVELEQYLGT